MANTGIANGGSASSVLYNPGAISSVEADSVSASGSSYYLMQSQPGSGAQASFYSLNSVPTSMISTWKMGEGVFAISLLVPASISTNYSAHFTDAAIEAAYPGGLDLELQGQNTQNLVGATWGRPVHRSDEHGVVRLGTSVFFSHEVTQSSYSFGSQSSTPNAILTSIMAKTTTISIATVFGLFVEKSPSFSYGVRLNPPSALLKADRSGTSYTQSYTAATKTHVKEDPSASWPTLQSWGLGLGANWKPSGRWMFETDFAIAERPTGVNGTNPGNAPVALSFGTRNFLDSGWSWLSGVRFDLTETFDKRGPTEGKNLDVMLAGGASWVKKDLETIVGAFYVKSIETENAPASSSTTIASSKIDFFGLTLSGAYKF